MDFLLTIIIFFIVFFIYLHITYHYKRSEDLEIYEFDYFDTNLLNDICDMKQPVLFDLKPVNGNFIDNLQKKILNPEQSDDVILKDSNDYFSGEETDKDYVVLPFHSVYTLLKTDTNSHFFIENNNEFIEESNYYYTVRELDDFLKPRITKLSFIIQTKYDICMGSKNTVTPLRHHKDYRRFYLVTKGKIHIKMTPFKSSKYLHPENNYENFEYCSPINVWNPQPKYLNDMDKIKFLEFDVNEGYVLYIPPYWWYSIKYSIEDDTAMVGVTYNSIMSILANSPEYIRYFIQQQNIYNKVTRTLQPVLEQENKENGEPGEIMETGAGITSKEIQKVI